MADARLDPWWMLPIRIGQMLASPRAALERVDQSGGAFRDGVLLTLVGLVAFRFQQVTEAVLAMGEAGGLGQLVGIWAHELNEAAVVVIPAAVLLTLLAGRQRDPAQDLDLAAACYTPFFAVRAVARATNAVAGEPVVLEWVGYGAAAAATLYALGQALRVIRARPTRVRPSELQPSAIAAPDAAPDAGDAPATTSLPRPLASPSLVTLRDGLAMLSLAAVVGIGLVSNAVWAARRIDTLKPMKGGQSAPDFSLPRIDGTPGSLSVSSLRGQVVLLDFWATWCPPCLQMIPVMEQLHHDWHDKGVAFLGVDSDGGQATDDEIRAFLQKHPAPYPMVIDDGRANSAYRIRALPQMVLISREGKVLRSFIGVTSRHELGAALEKALAQP